MLDYTILTWMHSRSLDFNEHKELCKKQKLMLQEAYFATRKKSNKRVRLSSKDILLKKTLPNVAAKFLVYLIISKKA